MKRKTLIISETTHDRLKTWGDENCIKINEWVDKLIQKELDELQKNIQPDNRTSN